MTRFPVMAVPPYPHQQPEDSHTPIIVVAAYTGICNLTGQFYSDYTSQSGPIASNKSAIWQLDRPSNAIYWDIEWRINLTSTGSMTIALNTGFVVLNLQGPTSNQGSWTTSTGQH